MGTLSWLASGIVPRDCTDVQADLALYTGLIKPVLQGFVWYDFLKDSFD